MNSTPIKLVVGLGNPGAQYAMTRHNAGFWLVDRYAQTHRIALRGDRAFHGIVGKDGARWLLMPETFMNRSGLAVGALARFYKIMPDEILVAHDELDLLPGAIKLKLGGGTAGHNGLRDIAAVLGTPQFWRMRIGIGHPRELELQQQVVDFVLHPPRRDEQASIDVAIERGIDVLPNLFAGEAEAAMMVLHTAPK
ncbi:MAG: aminoacyl-tRNA hydrolase [Burkholderiaceae bacterium]